MAIDMETLYATTFGDQETKLTVKRSWLKEVYKLLREGEEAKRQLEAIKRNQPSSSEMAKGFDKMDEGFDRIFGENGAFGHFFGKRGKR